MDLGPEKATSTCPENFAELDPDCWSRLLGAGKRFKGGAEACRLSLTYNVPGLGAFHQHRITCGLRVREAESRCARRPGRVEWS